MAAFSFINKPVITFDSSPSFYETDQRSIFVLTISQNMQLYCFNTTIIDSLDGQLFDNFSLCVCME